MIGEENTGSGSGYAILQPYRGSFVQDFKSPPTVNPYNMQVHQRQTTNPRTNVQSTKYYFSFKNVTGVITGIEVVDSINSAADKVIKVFLLCTENTKVLVSLDLTYKSGTKFSSYGESFAKRLPYLYEAVINKIPVKLTPYDFLDAQGKRQIGLGLSYVNLQGQEVKVPQYWKKETIPAQYNAIERFNPMSQKTEWDYAPQVYYVYEVTKSMVSDWRQKGILAPEKPKNTPHQPVAGAPQQFQQPVAGAPQQFQQPAAGAPQQFQQPAAGAPQQFQQPAAGAPQQFQQPGTGVPPSPPAGGFQQPGNVPLPEDDLPF